MILVLNLGSSSLKYALFSTQLKKIRSGNFEHITNHEKTLKTLFSSLSKKEIKQIKLIGHRVVHGGELFTKPTKITPQVLKKLKTLNELAPLHNPINIKGIEICQKLFPKIPNIAVFDTAFHANMKPEHFLYALPSKYYQKYGIRKYGFHGISHQYLRETYKTKYAPKNKKDHTIITCHLGNGDSVTLIRKGKVIETSMGFTPLEGLIMGTRCGDIDPAILPFLMKKENLGPDQINNILNKKSGLLALSQKTNDMESLLKHYKKDKKAKLAVDMFTNSVIKHIGEYIALNKGVDAIIFSGGIGEKAKFIRNKIKQHFKFLGELKYYTISTDEEYMIAKECKKFK